MTSCNKKTDRQNQYVLASSTIFFACFYLYTWLVIDPSLIYHSFGRLIPYPDFIPDFDFFRQTIFCPGGLVTYLTGFLSQWLFYPAIGAFILTFLAFIISFVTRYLFCTSSKGNYIITFYIIPMLVLIGYSRYQHQLDILLALLTALAFTVAFKAVQMRTPAVRAASFFIMHIVLYCLAGAASLLFGILAAIYELSTRRNGFLSTLYLLISCACIWLIGAYAFDLPLKHACLLLLPVYKNPKIEPDLLAHIALNLLYIFILISALLTAWYKHFHHKIKKAQPAQITKTVKNRKLCKSIMALQIILLISASTVVVLSFDKQKKKQLEINYFSSQKMWNNLLNVAAKLPPQSYNIYCNHDVNLALYHTGQLLDKMFAFPQKTEALLLNVGTDKPPSMVFLKKSNLFFELGDIGTAERLAHEFLEMRGNCPFVLEHLAYINIVKGQTENAKVFLKKLSKNIIYRKHAKKILKSLENDPQLLTNEYLNRTRSLACEFDNTGDLSLEDFLTKMLKKKNKMAFEYMMAYYLLTCQLDQIVTNVKLLSVFGYKQLPYHYEEALLLYQALERKKIRLHGFKINPQTVAKCKEFDSTYGRYGGEQNKIAAMKALEQKFSQDYIFYYIFSDIR